MEPHSTPIDLICKSGFNPFFSIAQRGRSIHDKANSKSNRIAQILTLETLGMVSRTDVPFRTTLAAGLFDFILTWNIFSRCQPCQNAIRGDSSKERCASSFSACSAKPPAFCITPFVENTFAFHFHFRNSFLLRFCMFVPKFLNLKSFDKKSQVFKMSQDFQSILRLQRIVSFF